MNIEMRDKTIPGIRRLVHIEEGVRSNNGHIIPGVWYLEGIMYNTGSYYIAKEMQRIDIQELQKFKALNEVINQRGRQKLNGSHETNS